MNTLEELKEFAAKIPEDKYNQSLPPLLSVDSKDGCGCLIHHLYLAKEVETTSINEVKELFNLSDKEKSYIFSHPVHIRDIAVMLCFPPDDEKDSDLAAVIKRIQNLINIRK